MYHIGALHKYDAYDFGASDVVLERFTSIGEFYGVVDALAYLSGTGEAQAATGVPR